MRRTAALLLAIVLNAALARAQPAPIAEACPAAPPPQKVVEAVNYYVDARNSVPDPALLRRYLDLTAELRRFLHEVGAMSDRALAARDGAVRGCALAWLDSCASGGALARAGRDGGVVLTMAAASLSATLVKLLALAESCEPNLARVVGWIDGVVRRVVAQERAGRPPGLENNVTYWTAYAALNLAIAVRDKPLRVWARGVHERALDGLTPAGFLPRELARGEKALEYQLFALTPLVMLRTIGAAAGEDGFALRDEALHRALAAARGAARREAPTRIGEAVLVPDRALLGYATNVTLLRVYACAFPDRAGAVGSPPSAALDWRLGSAFDALACPSPAPLPRPALACGIG
jgi:poly(beta-D-mannuronate) lyase